MSLWIRASIQIPRPSGRSWLAAAALVLLVALAFTIPRTRNWILGSGGPSRYMAVLPLRAIGDDALQYVADGVGDALSAKLSGLKEVYLASGSTVNDALDKKDPAKIARALGVSVLLRGDVTISGDQISVTIRMDDFANKPRSLLNQAFPGRRGDLLALEHGIFMALVKALEIRQTREEQARTGLQPTQNIGAYDLYLRGRNLLRGKQDQAQVKTALDLFDKATSSDPTFALAFAGVADANLTMFDLTADKVWAQNALNAAQHADALNDNLPEVHFSLGSIYSDLGKGAEAIAELQHALQLAPNSDEGLRRLGAAYQAAGQRQQAIDALTRATTINRYLWKNFNLLGKAYYLYGENDKALEAFRHVTQLEPDLGEGWANIATVYFSQAKWSESIQALQQAIDRDPKPLYYSNLGAAYFYLGRFAESVKVSEKAVEKMPKSSVFRANLADAYRWAGQRDKAAAAYDEAITLALKVTEVNPRHAGALGILAICWSRKGDDARALQYISQARQIKPTDKELMYQEATIHALAGRNAQAAASLEEALRNGFSLQLAESDPELAELRKTPEFGRLAKELTLKSP